MRFISSSLLFVCLMAPLVLLQAGTIETVSVKREREMFHVSFAVRLAVDSEKLSVRLLDHAHFHELSQVVVWSEPIESDEDTEQRRMMVEACILFFCPQFVLLEQINRTENGFTATVIPGRSDFRKGKSRWHWTALAPNQTQLIFQSTIQPDFWIPPIIGRWLLEKRLQRELGIMIRRLEDHAA